MRVMASDLPSADTHDKDTSTAAGVPAKVGSTKGEDGRIHGSHEEEDDDELEQAPLMRHESNVSAQAAHAGTTANPILSYGTTLVEDRFARHAARPSRRAAGSPKRRCAC